MLRSSPISHAARSAAARRIRFAVAATRLNCSACGARQYVDANGVTEPHDCPGNRVPTKA